MAITAADVTPGMRLHVARQTGSGEWHALWFQSYVVTATTGADYTTRVRARVQEHTIDPASRLDLLRLNPARPGKGRVFLARVDATILNGQITESDVPGFGLPGGIGSSETDRGPVYLVVHEDALVAEWTPEYATLTRDRCQVVREVRAEQEHACREQFQRRAVARSTPREAFLADLRAETERRVSIERAKTLYRDHREQAAAESQARARATAEHAATIAALAPGAPRPDWLTTDGGTGPGRGVITAEHLAALVQAAYECGRKQTGR